MQNHSRHTDKTISPPFLSLIGHFFLTSDSFNGKFTFFTFMSLKRLCKYHDNSKQRLQCSSVWRSAISESLLLRATRLGIIGAVEAAARSVNEGRESRYGDASVPTTCHVFLFFFFPSLLLQARKRVCFQIRSHTRLSSSMSSLHV